MQEADRFRRTSRALPRLQSHETIRDRATAQCARVRSIAQPRAAARCWRRRPSRAQSPRAAEFHRSPVANSLPYIVSQESRLRGTEIIVAKCNYSIDNGNMPSLTVRDIPKALLDRMRRAAKTERRSLNSQAVQWLEQSATQWTSSSELDLVKAIRAERAAMFRRHGRGTDSVELVRRVRRRGPA